MVKYVIKKLNLITKNLKQKSVYRNVKFDFTFRKTGLNFSRPFFQFTVLNWKKGRGSQVGVSERGDIISLHGRGSQVGVSERGDIISVDKLTFFFKIYG